MLSNMGRLTALFLTIAFLLALIPTLNMTRLQEVDELIYGRVAQEAAGAGHWAPLTCGGIAWSEKPPLLLWLAAVTAKWSGDLTASWPYRLWNCLAAALCVYAMTRLAAASGGWLAGLFAGLLFALQGDVLFHARFFTMDTGLLGCVLAAAWNIARSLEDSLESRRRAAWCRAGIWLALAAWIKSWFLLAFFPALFLALWLNETRGERVRAAFWIFGLALLGLASSLAFYVYIYGPGFLVHDWTWNLVNRMKGLSNEHIESNWSYYSKWSSRAAASLIPLSLAVPLGLLRPRRDKGGRRFGADFSLVLTWTWLVALCIIQAQVINYLLPLEAALCLGWACLAFGSEARQSLVVVLLAGLSCLNVHGGLEAGLCVGFSALGGLMLLLDRRPSSGCLLALSRWALHGLWIGLLLFFAARYLLHPDDPSRAVAEALLQNPSRYPGEVLEYFGPKTQALAFYSHYDVKTMDTLPVKRPPQATLIFDGTAFHFLPALTK